jgi:hypothetical protein
MACWQPYGREFLRSNKPTSVCVGLVGPFGNPDPAGKPICDVGFVWLRDLAGKPRSVWVFVWLRDPTGVGLRNPVTSER